MPSQPRRNPHSSKAVTIDDVGAGDTIIFHRVDSEDLCHVTLVGEDYFDRDENHVIEVEHFDGHHSVEFTSALGLTSERYSGEWVAVATTLHVPHNRKG